MRDCSRQTAGSHVLCGVRIVITSQKRVMPAYTPSEIDSLFRDAFNAGAVGSLTALYEPGSVLVVGSKRVIGQENICAAFKELVSQPGRMTLETRAVIESPEGLAVLHGTWIVEPQPGIRDAVATQGISTEVVRKQADGTWLFVIDNPYTAR